MMSQLAVGDWRWIALRAVAAFIFGVLALVLPGLTLATLVLLFGAFALVDGIFTLAHAFTRGASGWGLVWMILMGVAGIGAGIVTFFWPGITALALLYVIAAWALVTGAFEIATAIAFRKVLTHEWLFVVDGILSFIVAGILFFAPVAGALAITWAIGFYALFSSGVLAAQAWRLRKVRGRGVAGGWAPAGA
jgi:uncharacterized membrane protein HdeD (DUF308 family)